MEKIIAAAIQIEGVTLSLPKPARHGQVLHSVWWIKKYYIPTCCQGFLTSEGRFVNRVQARQIAWVSGQLEGVEMCHDRDLFSEDLW